MQVYNRAELVQKVHLQSFKDISKNTNDNDLKIAEQNSCKKKKKDFSFQMAKEKQSKDESRHKRGRESTTK